jgi:ubiquinone/menaquinone biosynthesis C-methylase UbiE/uncharacterized protein YbaR (Trm112 family)
LGSFRLRPSEATALACPTCRGRLALEGAAAQVLDGDRIERGRLGCRTCGARWPIEGGLPRLFREDEVRGNDRLLRLFYDHLPRLHDPVVRLTLPLFQTGRLDEGTEAEMRQGYLRRIELDGLCARDDGRPPRILEVGIGTGANLMLVRAALPPAIARRVEIWGVDLSRGMLGVLLRRLARAPDPALRLLMADAHALPFDDASFDRVFHVGALGSFRDPARALAEMARVARPGTPIVAVDEQLDPSRRHGRATRAAFRLVTFYERRPHAPVEALPDGAFDVLAEQVSPFFYCLRFRILHG